MRPQRQKTRFVLLCKGKLVLIHQSNFLSALSLLSLEPIPAMIARRRGTYWTCSPVHCRVNTERQTTVPPTLTPADQSLDGWEEAGAPGEDPHTHRENMLFVPQQVQSIFSKISNKKSTGPAVLLKNKMLCRAYSCLVAHISTVNEQPHCSSSVEKNLLSFLYLEYLVLQGIRISDLLL